MINHELGNIVYIRFDKLKVKTEKGMKTSFTKEKAIHAVAEEFLDLRLGNHFFFRHWIFLVGNVFELHEG